MVVVDIGQHTFRCPIKYRYSVKIQLILINLVIQGGQTDLVN